MPKENKLKKTTGKDIGYFIADTGIALGFAALFGFLAPLFGLDSAAFAVSTFVGVLYFIH